MPDIAAKNSFLIKDLQKKIAYFDFAVILPYCNIFIDVIFIERKNLWTSRSKAI
jgi:hypothetical protein